MGKSIYFYHQDRAYGFFSNFSQHAIFLNGHQWPTSEHYFQAQKFAGTPHESTIRNAISPGLAAKLGRDRSRPLRQDWEEVKNDVMRQALNAKFTQHQDLRQKLIATGSAKLIEHTPNDSYWGDGGDGSGSNMLGRLLMEIRSRLIKDGQSGQEDLHLR